MRTFEFTIIGSGMDATSEDFEDRFFRAGCDDATISFQNGHIVVDFDREAESIDAAVDSAVENVRMAGMRVERIERDRVG